MKSKYICWLRTVCLILCGPKFMHVKLSRIVTLQGATLLNIFIDKLLNNREQLRRHHIYIFTNPTVVWYMHEQIK